MNWISCKDKLPDENVIVVAKNPHCEALSWINGKNEIGKPRWFHNGWEHADDYVTHWKHIKKQ